MTWNAAQDLVRQHLFKIETPDGYGTGFLFVYNATRTAIGIATADHVLTHANKWQQPIRIMHAVSGYEAMLAADDRVIFPDVRRDTAALLAFTSDKSVAEIATRLPKNTLTLVDASKFIRVGVPVGWLGYPSISPETLCFFRGHVSAFQVGIDAYLIDGVSIHGLSGGPVFTEDEKDPSVLGSISAYLPNRAAGTTLPGLIQAYDLTALHKAIATIRNADEARAKAAEAAKQAEAIQAGQAAAVPVPPVSPAAPAVSPAAPAVSRAAPAVSRAPPPPSTPRKT